MSFGRLKRVRSASRESCAWSCGPLRRLFRGTVCSQASSAACAALGTYSFAVVCSSLSKALRLVEVAVSRTSERPVSRKKTPRTARLGCDDSSQVCQSSVVSRSLEPNSGLACTEGCLCQAVLREPREEPFEGPLPDLVVDRCSVVFLQDCVAVKPEDVVDTANSQTFPKDGELCALLASWSVTNCRNPNATPSVILPSVTAEILAKLLTSPMFHSSGAASSSCALLMTSVFSGFRSAPTLALATSKSCRKGNTRMRWHMISPSSMYH